MVIIYSVDIIVSFFHYLFLDMRNGYEMVVCASAM